MRARLDEQLPSDSTAADRALLDAHEQAGNIAQDDQFDNGFIAGIDHAIRCRALAWRQHPGYLCAVGAVMTARPPAKRPPARAR